MNKSYTENTWPKDRWKNFSFGEIKCKHTGKCVMSEEAMDLLQRLRSELGFGLTITSGYRDKQHPVEAKKIAEGTSTGGAHTYGKAFDIAIDGEKAYRLIGKAIEIGFTGIGVSQKGESRFVHIDTINKQDDPDFGAPRPHCWSY